MRGLAEVLLTVCGAFLIGLFAALGYSVVATGEPDWSYLMVFVIVFNVHLAHMSRDT